MAFTVRTSEALQFAIACYEYKLYALGRRSLQYRRVWVDIRKRRRRIPRSLSSPGMRGYAALLPAQTIIKSRLPSNPRV